ncbi:sensor histidine kinase [Antarcticimicrobium sediminis]|uniref:histidine kinase n=1 Tax=Antarcticimicrobium sediminis TaxID=2546227 RepID=A0A4R5EJ93_9RHOB|nr:HAMP domain-containing sensor histidine kinase [Antarcticimicrobium sediminis]TDE34494.1 HAMP domain-containing histidine kinase [Antarcticimicrobium sediminis]
MRRLSLRLRLALVGALAVVGALAIASTALTALFAAHVQRRAEAELSVQLDQVVAGLGRGAGGALELQNPPADPRFDHPLSGLYWQIELDGAILRARSLWDHVLPLPPDDLRDGQVHIHSLPDQAGGSLLTLERSVTLTPSLGSQRVRAAVALTTADLKQARADFVRDLIPYNVILAIALILAGWVQLFFGLRPLAEVGKRVLEVRSGHQKRLGDGFPREVLPLANAVDALIDARDAELERARRRAGDLAHGFKTPLQALLGEADRLRKNDQTEAARAIEEIADAMRRHVDRELTRSRLAGGATTASSNVERIVQRIISVVSRTPLGAALTWDLKVPDALNVALDPNDLTEALGAVIENASHYAKERIEIRAIERGSSVEIEVQDDGPGIDENRIGELRKRGARVDESGHGLGFAISAEIAEAVGGRLTVVNTSPGLCVALHLPKPAGCFPAKWVGNCRAMRPKEFGINLKKIPYLG